MGNNITIIISTTVAEIMAVSLSTSSGAIVFEQINQAFATVL